MSSISDPPWRNGKLRAAPDLTLWGVGTSRTVRPHWAMYELGLPYQTKAIGPRTGETKTTEYTRLNPRQKVPLLQDGDFCIGESAAIVAYLSQTYSTPDRSLIPEAPREYAVWLEWCFFVVAELDSTSLYVMRRHRADALGPIYGIAPEVVAKAGEYFREQLRHVEVARRARPISSQLQRTSRWRRSFRCSKRPDDGCRSSDGSAQTATRTARSPIILSIAPSS